MRYRRAFVQGGSYFFTVVTHRRRPLFSSPDAVDVLRRAFRNVRATRPFRLEAMVVLPDHLHCIWTLPPGDCDFATRWRLIKTWFTKHCDPALRQVGGDPGSAKSGQPIWQHRYWEHLLRDEKDFIHHLEYIHFNPVRHGLAASPAAWPYSSFHAFVKAGIYGEDWGEPEHQPLDVGRE